MSNFSESCSSLDSEHYKSNNSRLSLPIKIKRRISENKMLSKAKDTTKSLVQEVLEKRHSLDSKRSLNSTEEQPNSTSIISNKEEQQNNTIQSDEESKLKSIKKRLSICKSLHRNSLKDSDGLNTIKPQDSVISLEENNSSIIDTVEKPGQLALACDFRLANEKQNDDFHSMFKSVPTNDLLIESYKCAYQKEILLQGHLYISEHHVCFKSNIFGYVTNLVINFSEVITIEKKMTAKIIPNGILISTNTSTHSFASFLSRDQAYDQLMKIWDLNKKVDSVKQSSLSNESIDQIELDHFSDDSIISVEAELRTASPPVLITEHPDDQTIVQSIPLNTVHVTQNLTTVQPTAPVTLLQPSPQTRPRSISDSNKKSIVLQPPSPPPPVQLKRTGKACPCIKRSEQHPIVALDTTFYGTVEAMNNLLFKSNFFKNFLEKYENFEDVQSSPWKNGSREISGKRKIKSSTSGSRMINILYQEKRQHRKLPYYCCVSTKKSMPDMPMGSVYSVQSRTCITKVNKDKVHILITFEVIFSKSGFVSSIIEKNAADDQLRLYHHLNTILKRPELMKKLIDEPELLNDPRLFIQPSTKKQSKDWKSTLSDRLKSIKATDFVYIGFFLVLVTHCLLALRIQRITDQMEFVQLYQKQQRPQSINEKIKIANQRLHQIKNEIDSYDKRIHDLKSQSNLKL